jgi:hypothetical protein
MKRRIEKANKETSGLEEVVNSRPRRQYTRDQVAWFANVCKHTVAKDVRRGLLQETKFNRRRLRYDEDAVKVYLSAKGQGLK